MLRRMKTVLICSDDGTIRGRASHEEAHAKQGTLHRAFSIFVFRKGRSEMLIQQRSNAKTLFPLLWANACCSHLQEDEGIVAAGRKRLQEEMGFSCTLTEGPSFVYRAEDGTRGSEYEYDTILIGDVTEDLPVTADPAEVADWKWATLSKLREDIGRNPKQFAPWFILGLAMILRPHPTHAN
jgi:isopentenyl-diphosphate delta-isomerase